MVPFTKEESEHWEDSNSVWLKYALDQDFVGNVLIQFVLETVFLFKIYLLKRERTSGERRRRERERK